jgi:hypothetical protein
MKMSLTAGTGYLGAATPAPSHYSINSQREEH